jgi:hypothetical protein
VTRVPTEKQYAILRMLGSGAAGLSFTKRAAEPLLRRGWVDAEWRAPYYQFVRITPDGLRALADAVEKYGLPSLGPNPEREVAVCSDCGRDWRPRCRCGGRHLRYQRRAAVA